MKNAVTKKLIPYLLIGFLIVATLAFVALVGNKNPSDAAKKVAKEKAEQQVRSTPDSEAEDARAALLSMEKEVRELRAREQAAIDAKMKKAATGEDKDDEAKRVAKSLGIDVPRAPGAVQPAGVPQHDARLAGQMESAHRAETNAASNLGVFENYKEAPPATYDNAMGNNRGGAEDTPRSNTGSGAQQGSAGGSGANAGSGGSANRAATTTERAVKNQPSGPATMPKLPYTKQYLLSEGAVIRTVFVTGVNSQNPGKVIVRVTEDVYDSIKGFNLLIPKGTQMVGSYTGDVKAGQERLAMGFDRLVFPDGRSVPLPKMPAMARTGEIGVNGEYHSNMLGAIMPSLIVGLIGGALDYMSTKGVADSLSGTATGTANTNAGVSTSQSVVRQVFPNVANRLAERYADRKPYFTIEPGSPFAVMVTADFAIPPGEGAQLLGSKN